MSGKQFLFILISAWHAVFASWAQSYWQLQAELSPLAPPVNLAVVNDQSAWLCDFNGQVWRTNDAGKTWRLIATVTREEKISCLAAVDSNIAIAGGAGAERENGSANLYRTIDGGQSWQVAYTAKGPTPYWYAVHWFDTGNGIALSNPPSAHENFLIAKTNDAGATWRRIAQMPQPQEQESGLSHACFFYDHLHGWFGTVVDIHRNQGNRMFRTSDGGESWILLPNALSVELQALHFISPSIGLRASAQPPFLARTTDSGQTWQPINDLPVAEVQYLTLFTGVNAASHQQLWLYGEAGPDFRPFILTSVDGGLAWEEQILADVGVSKVLTFAAIAFGASNDSVQAWGVVYDFHTKRGGIISYRAACGATTVVQEKMNELPHHHVLAQNYPNPFNSSTVIQYVLQRTGHAQLVICNLRGERVRTLVDTKESAGVKQATWDGRDEHGQCVSSGVYLYRFQAGEFSVAKRLLLMK
ncbi:T9SS C-terminal target domain-containing protein [candidate division KSB1 bacterium]|nr:MAG: T9SS C-terminal target domain-containing protein [candidate division KSB1 bacterium]MCE7944686.1 T9SS C-terminal target domain-containing protein [Chlorobi bacterium CHB1]MDL1873750.1 T9SS type A sorting domain-containing protein [Cytophagia bacterium CHB2]